MIAAVSSQARTWIVIDVSSWIVFGIVLWGYVRLEERLDPAPRRQMRYALGGLLFFCVAPILRLLTHNY